MGKANRLPDINAAIVRFRGEMLTALKVRDYNSCFGSLHTLNAELPIEYQVNISTKDYEEQTSLESKVICNKCKDETSYIKLKIFNKEKSFLLSTVSQLQYYKAWLCFKCKSINDLNQTRLIQPVKKEPFFLKVVPAPPERRDGLIETRNYHQIISRWLWNFLGEIEFQNAKYRDDYRSKFAEEESQLEIDTTSEGDF